MADDNTEIIGGVGVTIEGDYSPLVQAFSDAQSAAQTAGADIADALSSGAAGASSAADTLTASLGDVSGAADTASAGLKPAGEAVQEVGEKARESSSEVGDFIKTLMEIGGITVSIEALKGFAEECVESFAAVERATIALTFLTGSAATAGTEIESLKAIAMNLAIPFEQTIALTQKLSAAGLGFETITAAITGAADAAARRGTDFQAASTALDRIAEGGMVGGRQLQQLGLQLSDLARVTDSTTAQVKAAWAKMDVEQRIDILVAATQRFAGAAEALAVSTSGSLTNLKNSWTYTLDAVGSEIKGLDFSPLVGAMRVVGTAAILTAEGFKILVASIKLSLAELYTAVSGAAGLVKDVFERNWLAAAIDAQSLSDSMQRSFNESSNGMIVSLTNANVKLSELWADVEKGTAESKKNFGDLHKVIEDALGVENLPAFVPKVFSEMNLEMAYSTAQFHIAAASEKGLNDEIAKAPGIIGQAVEAHTELARILDQANASMTTLGPHTRTLDEDMQALTGHGRQLGSVISDNLILSFKDLQNQAGTSLADVENGWANMSGIVTKLAKVDLPAAAALESEYISLLKQHGATSAQVYEAELNYLKMIAANSIGLRSIWAGLALDFNNAFQTMAHGISGAIVGAQSWHQAWQTAIKSIGESILDTIIGGALKQLSAAIMNQIPLFKLLAASQITDALAANAAIQASGSITRSEQVMGEAAVGEASAFAAYAGIPFVGLELGAAAAAAELSAIGAFLPLAAAEGGFDVGNQSIVTQLHPYEMVLPADISGGLRSMIQGGGGGSGTPVVFQNCQFTGVSQNMVADLMNNAIKQVRRVGGKL